MKKLLISILLIAMIFAISCNNTPTPTDPESTPESTPEATEPCTEHIFGEWEITTAPTCTETGLQNHVCENCGFKEEQTLEATGHIYTETTDRADCQVAGTLTRTCVCGKTETEDLPAGHAFTEWSSDIVVANVFIGHQRRDCKFCDFYETKYESVTTDLTVETFVELDVSGNKDFMYYARQGGCYNGKNFYQALHLADRSPAVVAKKNIETGEITYSEPRIMGHANDMTYNSKLNQVVVCNNEKILLFFDADTLEFVKEVNLKTRLAAVSYNPHNDTYTGYGNANIYTLDAEFNFIRTFAMKKTLSTSQGICSDSTYVYNIYTPSSSGRYECFIVIHDHNENYVTTLEITIPGHYEAENLSIIDGQLYIMVATPTPIATLYKILPKA